MTTPKVRTSTSTSVSSPVQYEFRWEQDDRQRVLKLSGVIDSNASSHLESAITNLGSRRLLIDLSRVTTLDPSGAAILLEIVRRLGAGRVSVMVDPGDESGVVLTEIADVEVLSHSA